MAKNKKTRKQTRKELLKEEDAFIDAANQSIAWVDKNKNLVIALTIGLATVIALGWGGMEVMALEKSESSSELEAAMKILNAEVAIDESTAAPDAEPPVFASDEARLKAARVALEGVVASGSSVADIARFYAVDTQLKLGDKDAAAAGLGDLIGSLNAGSSLYFLAIERLALLQESMGKSEDAIKTYEKITENRSAFYRDAATYELARIHHAQGRTDKARDLLAAAKREFPTSTLGSSFDSLLKELGGPKVDPAAEAKATDKAE